MPKKESEEQKKAGKFRAGYYLLAESFELLRKEPTILFLAFFSGILSFAFTVIVFLIYFSIELGTLGFDGLAEQVMDPRYVLPVSPFLISAFVYILISTLYQVAIMAMISARIEEKTMKLSESRKFVEEKGTAIFEWAIFSSLVVSLYAVLSGVENIWLSFFCPLAAIAWIAGTFFVVPSIASENTSLFKTFRHSFNAMKEVWAETISAVLIFEILAMAVSVLSALALIILFIFIVGMAGSFYAAAPIIPAFIVLVLFVLSIFFSFLFAMRATMRLVLFRYSKHGAPLEVSKRHDFVLASLKNLKQCKPNP